MVRLRWDWLGPSVTVPFVPTIGPVHPGAVGPSLFADVISVAGTDRFLAYDKDRRWFEAKAESVLVDDIVHRRHETWFPVLSRLGAGSVTVYVYGGPPHDHQLAGQLASRLRSSHGAATASVVWFLRREDPSPPTAHITSVQLQEFTSEQGATVPETVQRLNECPGAVVATFVSFVRSLADEGFAFLHGRMAGAGVGPVLVAVDEDRIVGAIGPMEIMSDPTAQRGCFRRTSLCCPASEAGDTVGPCGGLRRSGAIGTALRIKSSKRKSAVHPSTSAGLRACAPLVWSVG